MFVSLWGTHLCDLCVDTRWLAHVLRDRPDDSHGKGGLLQVGGLVADAFWSHGFKVALLTLCLFVGGKQKKVIKITISARKIHKRNISPSSPAHHTVTQCSPCGTAPLCHFVSSAAVSSFCVFVV